MDGLSTGPMLVRNVPGRARRLPLFRDLADESDALAGKCADQPLRSAVVAQRTA